MRQAERFDPDGVYVRRWVPELESVRGKAIFRPWLMEGFADLDYPEPIVDHDDAVAEFRRRRGILRGSADGTPGHHPRLERTRSGRR